MRAAQRNILLLGLAAASGSLDCWSYFGLAHTFIANMTGNTVLLGFALANAQWARAAGTGAAILGYFSGVVAGARLARPVRRAVQAHQGGAGTGEVLWPKRLAALLSLEWLLLFIAVLAEAAHTPVVNSMPAHSLVCLCAVAVGVQSAAITALQVQGVATTYITGTWTTVAVGLAELFDREGSKAGKQSHGARIPNGLRLELSVLLIYLAAAAGSGLCLRAGGRTLMGLPPLALLLGVIAAGLAWQGAAGKPQPAQV